MNRLNPNTDVHMNYGLYDWLGSQKLPPIHGFIGPGEVNEKFGFFLTSLPAFPHLLSRTIAGSEKYQNRFGEQAECRGKFRHVVPSEALFRDLRRRTLRGLRNA